MLVQRLAGACSLVQSEYLPSSMIILLFNVLATFSSLDSHHLATTAVEVIPQAPGGGTVRRPWRQSSVALSVCPTKEETTELTVALNVGCQSQVADGKGAVSKRLQTRTEGDQEQTSSTASSWLDSYIANTNDNPRQRVHLPWDLASIAYAKSATALRNLEITEVSCYSSSKVHDTN